MKNVMFKHLIVLCLLLLTLGLTTGCTKSDDSVNAEPTDLNTSGESTDENTSSEVIATNKQPTITGEVVSTVELNTLFFTQLSISDEDGFIADVKVEGLPSWMTFDEDTYQLSGTPTESGDFEIKVIATDNLGLEYAKAYDVRIEETRQNEEAQPEEAYIVLDDGYQMSMDEVFDRHSILTIPLKYNEIVMLESERRIAEGLKGDLKKLTKPVITAGNIFVNKDLIYKISVYGNIGDEIGYQGGNPSGYYIKKDESLNLPDGTGIGTIEFDYGNLPENEILHYNFSLLKDGNFYGDSFESTRAYFKR